MYLFKDFFILMLKKTLNKVKINYMLWSHFNQTECVIAFLWTFFMWRSHGPFYVLSSLLKSLNFEQKML